MAYSDVINKLGQIKQANLDLITKQIPPGKGGSPGQPYDPPKPTGPYMPAPKRVSTPQDGRAPNTLFYNNYDEAGGNNQMFIKDKQMIEDAKTRFKWNTGINLANLTPKMFTPFDMGIRDKEGGLLPHIITPAIRDSQMHHFKRFIKNSGESTWDLSQGNSPMLIAKGKKKKKKSLTIYDEAARRDAFRDMGNEPYDPDTGRMGGGFDIMDDVLGLYEA